MIAISEETAIRQHRILTHDGQSWCQGIVEPFSNCQINLGTYVLATKFSDCDPADPWRVGFVVRIIEDRRGITYIIGEADGTWSDFYEYRHAKKITKEEGCAWIEANLKPSNA